MDTYASIISNNMNVTIHRLTLVTIFIAANCPPKVVFT